MTGLSEVRWKPGSFTKNFAWGDGIGLRALYDNIRIGFNGDVNSVPRATYQRRISDNDRNWHIPLNFFLFNRQIHGVDLIIVDELVFQALTSVHTERFDKLALFAFNLSYAGRFRGASADQRRPALWANSYVRNRVARELNWQSEDISANDIERFILNDPRWSASGSRKVATNLNYLYKVGKLSSFATQRIERWWVDALFLALDRMIEDREIDGHATSQNQALSMLESAGFFDLTGGRSVEKSLASKHILSLYFECGGRSRFSETAVRERTAVRVKDIVDFVVPNSDDPIGAIHPTNPRILKSVPAVCAMLAQYAGFDIVDAMSLDAFDPAAFIKARTLEALVQLERDGIKPTMTAEELLRLTRGK